MTATRTSVKEWYPLKMKGNCTQDSWKSLYKVRLSDWQNYYINFSIDNPYLSGHWPVALLQELTQTAVFSIWNVWKFQKFPNENFLNWNIQSSYCSSCACLPPMSAFTWRLIHCDFIPLVAQYLAKTSRILFFVAVIIIWPYFTHHIAIYLYNLIHKWKRNISDETFLCRISFLYQSILWSFAHVPWEVI